jgi:hypothetical protein
MLSFVNKFNFKEIETGRVRLITVSQQTPKESTKLLKWISALLSKRLEITNDRKQDSLVDLEILQIHDAALQDSVRNGLDAVRIRAEVRRGDAVRIRGGAADLLGDGREQPLQVDEGMRTPNRTAPRTVHGRRSGIPASAFCRTFFSGLFVRLEPGFESEETDETAL